MTIDPCGWNPAAAPADAWKPQPRVLMTEDGAFIETETGCLLIGLDE